MYSEKVVVTCAILMEWERSRTVSELPIPGKVLAGSITPHGTCVVDILFFVAVFSPNF